MGVKVSWSNVLDEDNFLVQAEGPTLVTTLEFLIKYKIYVRPKGEADQIIQVSDAIDVELLTGTLTTPWASIFEDDTDISNAFIRDLWQTDRALINYHNRALKSGNFLNQTHKRYYDIEYVTDWSAVEYKIPRKIMLLFSGGKESLLHYLLASKWCNETGVELVLCFMQDPSRTSGVIEKWADLIAKHDSVFINTNFCAYMDLIEERVSHGKFNLFYDSFIGSAVGVAQHLGCDTILVGNENDRSPEEPQSEGTPYGASFNQSTAFCRMYTAYLQSVGYDLQIMSWLDNLNQLEIQYAVYKIDPALAKRQISCLKPKAGGNCMVCPKCLRIWTTQRAINMAPKSFAILQKVLDMGVREHDLDMPAELWRLIRHMAAYNEGPRSNNTLAQNKLVEWINSDFDKQQIGKLHVASRTPVIAPQIVVDYITEVISHLREDFNK